MESSPKMLLGQNFQQEIKKEYNHVKWEAMVPFCICHMAKLYMALSEE